MPRGLRVRPALARLVPALLLPLVGALLPACSHAETPVLPDSTVITITGHGYGHGHGMSQYGAHGAAAAGLHYRQILSFFYPHTAFGSAGGRIAVLITKATSRNLSVQSGTGLVAQQVGGTRTWNLGRLHPAATRWRIVPAGRHNVLEYLSHGWHQQSVMASTLQFYAGGRPIRLYLPHGAAEYRGALRSAAPSPASSDRDTVNIVALENYVAGVVPTEMPASWQPAALEAQAVAARTYAVQQRALYARRYYQICDTSACQNYGGYSAQVSTSDQAAAATAGQILTYAGQPAYAQFAASDGGWSRTGGEPYLVAKQDVYKKYADDPYRNWTASVTVKRIEAHWPSVGPVTSVSLSRDTTKRWVSGVTIRGRNGTVQLTGDAFAAWAGLRSAWFGIKVG